MMLLIISRQEFDSIDDTLLWSACFEPIIKVYKVRMSEQTHLSDHEIKSQFYEELTDGQRALFMFLAFYNHAKKSLEEFYWWNAYYLAQPKIWSEIAAGLRYFNADSMLQILKEMEKILTARNYPRSLEKFNVTHEDLNHDSELLKLISPLNSMFNDNSLTTLKIIGKFIRNNPNEFMQFEN